MRECVCVCVCVCAWVYNMHALRCAYTLYSVMCIFVLKVNAHAHVHITLKVHELKGLAISSRALLCC